MIKRSLSMGKLGEVGYKGMGNSYHCYCSLRTIHNGDSQEFEWSSYELKLFLIYSSLRQRDRSHSILTVTVGNGKWKNYGQCSLYSFHIFL